MAVSARVTAIEALVDFKAKLCRFGVDANNALAGLDMQLRRVFEWLEEQTDFWKVEIRRREEEVVRAKNQLYQRKAMGGPHGRGPGYTEQEVALEEAQERLREAQTKLKNCRHWTLTFPREVTECEGPARTLRGMLEADLRQAVGLMEQKIQALEAYVQLTSGGPETPPAPLEKQPTSPAALPDGGKPGAGPAPGTPPGSPPREDNVV